jgi:GT2 family glycosyltransferase
MPERLPEVEVIIVNYNGRQHIPACLGSLFRTDYPHFTVTMVDNASKDGSVEWTKSKYPSVKIIQNEKNLGFGRANNIAVKAGQEPIVCFLNSDTVVDRNWLRPLIRVLMEDPSNMAACSKLLFMKTPRVLNGVGGGINHVGYGYDIGIFEIDDGRFDGTREVFFPCAAACALKRAAFLSVDGFDEKFFMYHEDVDLGWRLHLVGGHVKCVPDSVVYHAFGGTSPKSSSMVFRNNLGQRHAIRSLLKNYEMTTLVKILPLVVALGLRDTLRGRSLSFVRASLWNIKLLPDTIRERVKVQGGRIVGDGFISSLIWRHISLPVRFPDYQVMNLESFSAGKNKRPFIEMSEGRWENLGYGWHGIETYFGDGKTKYRWSKDEAVLYLWSKGGPGRVSLEVLGLSRTIGRPRELSVSVNGEGAFSFVLQSDGWEKVSLPYAGKPGPLEIKIRVRDCWCPADHFRNGDNRHLGIGLKRAEFVRADAGLKSFSGISVIIPTYNRIAKLLRVLRALEGQTLNRKDFEVIVVDDGSTDSTPTDMMALRETTALQLIYLRQSNKKQGAARNLGIKHARMPLVVFIGDDIIPAPNFLEEHLAYHRKSRISDNLAVIGYTTWPKDLRITPFMKYIAEYGFQFGYSLIEGSGPVPFNFFYTSNISMPLSMLEGLEHGFEEDFDTYGWEDIELGYRLESAGMRLCYNPAAVAYHDHPMDIPSFCQRQLKAGRASRVFLRKHPELEWLLGGNEYLRSWARWTSFARTIGKAVQILDSNFLIPLPRVSYQFILNAHYGKGGTSSRD